MRLLPIGKVAEQFGVRGSTLRYYEELGLLSAPVRRGGRRYYDDTLLRRLALIQVYADSGLTLRQIKEILDSEDSSERFHEVLTEHRDRLTEQIARATEAKATIEHHLTCSAEFPMRCAWWEDHLQAIVDRKTGP